MSTLGKAVISFAADTATFTGDISRAAASFGRAMGRMQAAARGLDGPLAKLTAGLSIAGVGLFAKNVIDSADELGKLSQKVGISTEKLSELKLAAELGNVSNESFAKGLRAFNQTLVEATNASSKASKVFAALGVDIKAGPAEAFRQFAESMSRLPDGELKTAAAMEILKKTGADWIPVLNGGARGLDDAGEKAKALGLVISDDFAKSAEKFNDNMKLIQKSTVGFANAILAGGVLDALVEITKNIEKAAEKGEKWNGIMREAAKLSLATVGDNPRFFGSWLSRPADTAARRMFGADIAPETPAITFDPKTGFLPKSPSAMFPGVQSATPAAAAAANTTSAGPDPEALRKALAENDAELKRYVSALRTLERELAKLNELTAEGSTLFEVFGRDMTTADGQTVHLEGSLEKLTAVHKTNLLNLSLEITARQQLIRISEIMMPILQAEIALREQAAEAFEQFVRAGNQANKEIAFQTKLLGLSVREQEKAIALRQIDLELQRRQAELARQAGDNVEFYNQENAKLEAEAKKQREDAIRGIEERQRVERDWATGSKQAFDEYVDRATNAAEQSRRLFTNAFRSMEDALVQFVKTGKLDFRSLADSIITDMIRIMVQRQIMGPILEGMGAGGFGGFAGGIGSFLGIGGGSAAGTNAAGVPFDVMDFMPMAKGGVMTSRGPMPLRAYSRGGVANSPQMAIFGEGSMNEAFVPLPDGRRIPVDLGDGGGARGGDRYYIDARGADREGLERLEATIRALDGSIEHRALSVTASARRRGGAYASTMKGR